MMTGIGEWSNPHKGQELNIHKINRRYEHSSKSDNHVFYYASLGFYTGSKST